MPGRRAKPPRLYQLSDGAWIIRDRGRFIRTGSTGSGADAIQRAAEKLADYIGGRHSPRIGERNPDRLPIADVLVAYADAKIPPAIDKDPLAKRRHGELLDRLDTLNEFFGDKVVGALVSQLCRDFVAWRTGAIGDRQGFPPPRRPVTSSTARRELEDLRAAVNLYHAEYILNFVPKITMPAKANARDRWLTKTEAARLLGAALGFVWDPERGSWKRDAGNGGRMIRRGRAVRVRRRHAARFILISLYNNRREATVRRTLWIPTIAAPWFDLDRMIYHGRGRDEPKTKKRRPPMAIANRLRPHLLRWRRLDQALADKLGQPVPNVIHKNNGAPLRDKIKTGWNGILADAGLGRDVVRHTLRHTAATWLAQKGDTVDVYQAAGFLGMTVEQFEETYGHHSPDFQQDAAGAFGGRRS